MIDDLLASPHYGERWGRYWLDLAGYADSEGGVSADPVRDGGLEVSRLCHSSVQQRQALRPLSARADSPAMSCSTTRRRRSSPSEMVDNLIATGFLRMGIDQTGSRTMNFVPERLGVISDAITIVGAGLMGLTHGVRSMSFAQVRSDSASRLLPVQGHLSGRFGRTRLDDVSKRERSNVATFRAPRACRRGESSAARPESRSSQSHSKKADCRNTDRVTATSLPRSIASRRRRDARCA